MSTSTHFIDMRDPQQCCPSAHVVPTNDTRQPQRISFKPRFQVINKEKISKNSLKTTPLKATSNQSDIIPVTTRVTFDMNEELSNLWIGSKLASQVLESKTPSIRNYWEYNISKEKQDKANAARIQKPKPYGFPKWRSSDALSASLVASNPIEIPKDSYIPEQRLKMMEDTYREAQNTKGTAGGIICFPVSIDSNQWQSMPQMVIQQRAYPQCHLKKGKSLDSLIIQSEFQPWYDRKKIREAISRESIANIGLTKERFETGYFPTEKRDRSPRNSSRFDSIPPPYLPPKSEEIQIRQNAHRNGYQDHSIGSYTSCTSGTTYFHQGMNELRKDSSQESPQCYQYTYGEQLLMLYIKQNPEIISSLGISFPDSIRCAIQNVPWRKVELRVIGDEVPSYQSQTSSSNHKQGRYVKKSQVVPVVLPPSIRSRKATENVSRGISENKRQSVEVCGKDGSSLIESEIRSVKEREEELRRSRSELGLPTLEDTMDMWRSGHHVPFINPLRSTLSYDYLNQDSLEPLPNTCSISELTLHSSYGHSGRSNENS